MRRRPVSGRLFGRYRVLHQIGRGGMGVVWAAHDPGLDRPVALKVLHQNISKADTSAHDRLLREARAMAKLRHPNVVAVYEVGMVESVEFVAMELVHGTDLAQWLKQPRTWREIVRVFLAAGRGLMAVHATGLVHRDFKPKNVLIANNGRVLVTDFGLARPLHQVSAVVRRPATVGQGVAAGDGTAHWTLTAKGMLVGTPGYMAPELFLGAPADARSDQFSFCVSLYQALFRRLPFSDKREEPSEPGQPGQSQLPPVRVPRWIDRVLRRGLSRDAKRRFGSMAELLAELERGYYRRRRPLRLRDALIAMAGGMAGVLAMVGASGAGGPECDNGRPLAAEIWNPTHHDGVHAAFAATQHPAAVDTSRRITGALDDYMHNWAAAYDDACAATHVRKEDSEADFAQRVVCLMEHRAQVDELVDSLAQPDACTLDQTLLAAQQLPDPRGCDEVDPVSARKAKPRTRARSRPRTKPRSKQKSKQKKR
ncbi:MAG: serine/threonine-protein kinase [Myxococcota bacterium]